MSLLQVLQLFTAEKNINDFASNPFSIGNFTYSTNRYLCCRTKKLDEVGFLKDKDLDIDKLFSPSNQVTAIVVATIKAAINKLPLTNVRKLCIECSGNGNVDWNYEGKNELFEKSFPCPVCDGDGDVITNKKKPDTECKFIKLGESLFRAELWLKILEACELLNQQTIHLTYKDLPDDAIVLLINQDLEILVMPYKATGEEEIILHLI